MFSLHMPSDDAFGIEAGDLNHHPVVVWVAHDGRQLHLSGGPNEGREGVWLNQGIEGIGFVDATASFVKAAHQMGESITEFSFDHGELDLPIYVKGEAEGDMQAIREMVKGMFSRTSPGWLAIWTPVTGWRWIRCHRKTMKPSYKSSPYPVKGMNLDLVLIAEDPRAESKPYSSLWQNESLSGFGELYLCASEEWHSWPTFIVSGPGSATLSMEGSIITLPKLEAGEHCLLQSDPARGVLRSVGADGKSRNRWPDVEGYLAQPIPSGVVSRIGIRVTGGSEASGVLGQSRVSSEGLL